MDFINKGKEFLSSDKGKEFEQEAKDGYATYQKTEGSEIDKAKAVYAGFQKNDKDDKDSDKK